ncbi:MULTISPECIES: LytR/AlgR family response regulator transcription factor [Pseudoalteromonas]|uniref:Chemotaxis protein CheY n=1 Tax=Pseudoalteromonas fuliginea TaxID=1872678 RepID=A0ABD3Y427_9GAMM|nr:MULTISPECIES: LytTR family DNA-binding domain-containing protein [Pseudoalteromonas]ALQ07575.1 two-component system response regulator [Pseudoalteromonas sp. Bsw20308]KAA1151604.1 response regulator transcription factor [Pseudoalteromonas fuliginea]KAA1166071.1 response regulator transcription factor [Pseudoalteromonas fuliginea]KDC48332.1 chemotaxis protein CheY [Pseudoalteromonas fuliginea]KDC53011.1 chemotaxis protein CheY [Pseudoalteromonas sp. S3431]
MNVLIVDDEPLARSRLIRLLAHDKSIVVQGEASNGNEALILAKKQTPDLIFLDVDMPGMNGLQVANELNSLILPPAIVFITAHPEHAFDALQLSAAGYLVKPISEQSLQKVLKQVGRLNKVHIQKQQNVKISYQLAGTLRSVDIKDVLYFSAEEKYTKMVFLTGEALLEQSLKQLELLYPAYVLRIHRNTLVNKKRVIALHSQGSSHHMIELKGSRELLPVSRRELKAVKSAL